MWLRYGLFLLLLVATGCACDTPPEDNEAADQIVLVDPVEPVPAAEDVVLPVADDSPLAGLFYPDRADRAVADLMARGPAAVPELIEALRRGRGDYGGMGYVKVIELLGRLKDGRAVDPLMAVLYDRDAKQYALVAPWAIWALQETGNSRCLPALEKVADDVTVSGELRVLAAGAIEKLTGQQHELAVPLTALPE